MAEAVIIEAVRVPFGRRDGVYRQTRPDSLLAQTLCGLIDRSGIDPGQIEDVISGCVTQSGEQGANISRLATLLAGFPVSVPAATLDRMCGSSQQAVHFAAQAVAAGDMRYAIGAGVESMTRVPMFSNIGGGFEVLNPDLLASYELVHQGESAERLAENWSISRQEMDDLAATSHRRAAAAVRAGKHTEIIPARGLDADGHEIAVNHDEGIRMEVDREAMAALPTVFRPRGNGVVTAGNASQIADGAAAVLVADRAAAAADGFRPRARFLARVVVGDDPTLQLAGVIPATYKALDKAGLTIADIDWIEINEAFASVVIAWARELNPDMARVNPWGGAIAHGHPLGATGAGLMAKLMAGLEAADGQFGLQVMCIGHGMATATIIERV
ncbi:MAG: thiolase family protein [Candidatus Promineifilaceae bacterium]|nr:thiolase family protein [Candidatus Promineifilaceae bacterium]